MSLIWCRVLHLENKGSLRWTLVLCSRTSLSQTFSTWQTLYLEFLPQEGSRLSHRRLEFKRWIHFHSLWNGPFSIFGPSVLTSVSDRWDFVWRRPLYIACILYLLEEAISRPRENLVYWQILAWCCPSHAFRRFERSTGSGWEVISYSERRRSL